MGTILLESMTGNISNGMRVWKVSAGKDLGKYREETNG